ncbi:translation initiation factor IF-2, partial [Bacteroidales bacterium MSK.15.36]|nr:translation initiation factor IF-2 [Bacteroidales bacterium MSK.15.36]
YLSTNKVSLEDLYSQIKEGKIKELNIIVKADVQGTIEAIRQSLEKLSTDEVKVRVIHGGVGAITETDVILANASSAVIIGFNVRPDSNAIASAEKENVEIKTYRVIYSAIEDIKKAMIGMLEPEYKEVIQGRAEVRMTYKISSVGTVAGCYVQSGKITRNSNVRIIREGIVIFESELASLKRFKDD